MARILVADDVPARSAQTRTLLEGSGYAVAVAADGRRAIDALSAPGPRLDLLVCGPLTPEPSGPELCRRVKADPGLRRTPVVLMTPLHDPADAVRALECGADQFVALPCRPEWLLARVRAALSPPDAPAGDAQQAAAAADPDRLMKLLLAACEGAGRAGAELYEARLELAATQSKAGRREQEALRESEERYRQLFEANPHVMWVYDPATLRFLAANDAAVQCYGRTREELLAMKVTDVMAPEEGPRLQRELAKPPGKLYHSGVWRHRRKDGAPLDMETTSHELAYAGRPARVVLAVNVTERRRLEERLRQSDKMEALGRLAGGVAHDFNNLLTVISGYGELALKGLGPDDPNRSAVREMLAAADRAAGLTRQLLTFSRHQVHEPRVLHLDAAVREAENMLRRLIGEDIALVVASAGAIDAVLADPSHVQQILLNLCVNARDAMPMGGRLTIETRNVELDEAQAQARPGLQPGPHVLLSVSDTGHGMTEEVQARVFEPFFTTKEAGKGSGIGLAAVYGAVRQSRGHISLHSAVNRGTTFNVYFPRGPADAPRDSAKSKSSIRRNVRGKETVLMVEDDDNVRALIRRVLEGNGYMVLEARDGLEALDVCRRHKGAVHLAITDVVMPHLGGRELADRLAAARPGLKVLFLSGYTEEAVLRHGVSEAEVHFLQKPFYPTVLAHKVREVLDAG